MWKHYDHKAGQPSRETAETVPEQWTAEGSWGISSSGPSLDTEIEVMATIGSSVYVKGLIIAKVDLTIEGQVDGMVEVQEHGVIVGPIGRVSANIKARYIVIRGSVTGNVEARHIIIEGSLNGNIQNSEMVEVRNGARVIGDVQTMKFVCAEQGIINGAVSGLGSHSAIAHNAPASSPLLPSIAFPSTELDRRKITRRKDPGRAWPEDSIRRLPRAN